MFRTLCSQWRQWFKPAGLAKFDEMVGRGELEVVCENERELRLTGHMQVCYNHK